MPHGSRMCRLGISAIGQSESASYLELRIPQQGQARCSLLFETSSTIYQRRYHYRRRVTVRAWDSPLRVQSGTPDVGVCVFQERERERLVPDSGGLWTGFICSRRVKLRSDCWR
jgi:hypothetical protein